MTAPDLTASVNPPTGDRHDTTDVAVVGGGLGALIAALTARRTGPPHRRVTLIAGRMGGRARCDLRDGYTLNRGPRALYLGGEFARALRDLGIEAPGWKANQRGGAAQRGGRLHLLPTGAWSMLHTDLLDAGEKVQLAGALTRVATTSGAGLETVTVREWTEATASSPRVRSLLEALVRLATYADAPEDAAAGPALANLRMAITSGVRYVDGGWQRLVDRLVDEVEGSDIEVVHEDAATVDATGAHPVVKLRGGTQVRAGSIVLAVGGPDASASLLGTNPPGWTDVGPPVTVACLELGLRTVPDRRFVLGLDDPIYYAVHSPGADLAPQGGAVAHLMRSHPLGGRSDPDEDRRRLDDVARGAGITSDQIATSRFLARMVVSHAVPRASNGGLAGRPAVEVPGLDGVFVAGDWVGPVGLLADAVASSATEAGRRAAERAATIGVR